MRKDFTPVPSTEQQQHPVMQAEDTVAAEGKEEEEGLVDIVNANVQKYRLEPGYAGNETTQRKVQRRIQGEGAFGALTSPLDFQKKEK